MKTFFLALAVVISWAGSTYGQQPAARQRFTTCSQQVAFCSSTCESGHVYRKGNCRAACQERHGECMATGFWTNPNTGEKVSRRRE
jgi:hypothetical protein